MEGRTGGGKSKDSANADAHSHGSKELPREVRQALSKQQWCHAYLNSSCAKRGIMPVPSCRR